MTVAAATIAKPIQCGICGERFDPVANPGCAGCPVNDGCLLACCPACGYSMPNPASSRLVRLAARLAARIADARGSRGRARRVRMAIGRRSRGRAVATTAADAPTLADAAPGASVRVRGIGAGAAEWREHLQAYGISRGREITVVQQSPVTVVRVDHVDLAFEVRIAREIAVDAAAGATPPLPAQRSQGTR
ncbi:MAG: ferrous iron transport protein A [Thermoleophilia bacterium]|nr:ferrous iron transport protein A [Thermoleophilia bacterium]